MCIRDRYSPVIGSIKVIRSGKVRRAKLYYLRDRKGKSARIAEKIKKNIGIEVDVKASTNEEPTSEITMEKKVELTKNSPEPKVEEKKEIKKSDKTK